MKLDVIAFGAHPDDVELAMGGTVARLVKEGKKVGVIDLTRGEMGSRGSAEIRDLEAEKAKNILGISIRENLNHPDCKVKPNEELIKKIIISIRKYKPEIIFAPHKHDRHPDHTGAAEAIKDAWFLSGVYKYETEYQGDKQEPYRPKKIYYFAQSWEFEPSFIVDISDTFNIKMEAVKAYSSQFHNPEVEGPVTYISRPGFIKYLESRSQIAGFKIGKDYGEPFFCDEKIELDLKNLLLES